MVGETEEPGSEQVYAAVPIEPGRSGRLLWLPFETMIALLLVVVGLNAILHPVGPVPALDYPVWFVRATGLLQLVSGTTILFGMWKMKRLPEMVGQVGLVTATFGQTAAAVLLGDPEIAMRSIVLFIVCFGCLIRLWQLIRGYNTILIGPRKSL